ncbi:MAG: hypothetical protein KKB50_08785 [Planctomycetes bacterium]|nr:hypothetical protein [Planctomycetota bacterium]
MIWSQSIIRPVCLTLTHLTTVVVLGLLVTALVCRRRVRKKLPQTFERRCNAEQFGGPPGA